MALSGEQFRQALQGIEPGSNFDHAYWKFYEYYRRRYSEDDFWQLDNPANWQKLRDEFVKYRNLAGNTFSWNEGALYQYADQQKAQEQAAVQQQQAAAAAQAQAQAQAAAQAQAQAQAQAAAQAQQQAAPAAATNTTQGSSSMAVPGSVPDATAMVGNVAPVNVPAGSEATVELRRLLLEAAQFEEQALLARYSAEQAAAQGNQAAATQAQQVANNYDIQSRQLVQEADQFAKTHGLAAEAQALAAEIQRGQLAAQVQQFGQTLAEQVRQFNENRLLQQQQMGQQESQFARSLAEEQAQFGQTFGLEKDRFGFEQDQYTTELASAPQNLIQSALWQGGRRAGGIQPDATAFGGNANTDTAASSEAFANYMGQQVPVAAGVNALLNRQSIAPTGTFQGEGFLTSLQNLQQNPNLRLNFSEMDAASLNNVLQDEQLGAELDSTLRAQGQDVNSFARALRGSMPRRPQNNTLTPAY